MFILNTKILGIKTMLVKVRERLTYLLSKNSQIRFWHKKLRHALNIKVVQVCRLTNGIVIKDEYKCAEEQFPGLKKLRKLI